MACATDLVKAAGEDNLPLVESLLKMFPSQIDIRYNGHTALHAASRAGHTGIMKTLLFHVPKPDLDFPDSKDCTPLHYAVKGNRPEAVRLLIRAGANIREEDEDGQTPYQIAFDKKHKECVKIFLNEGVKFKSKVVSEQKDQELTNTSAEGITKETESSEESIPQIKTEDLCRYCKENPKFVKFEPCGCIISCFECSFANAACMDCGLPIEKYSYNESPVPVQLIKNIKFMKNEVRCMQNLHLCKICFDNPLDCMMNECGHMFCISCVRKVKDKKTQYPNQHWICSFCKASSRYTQLHADWLN